MEDYLQIADIDTVTWSELMLPSTCISTTDVSYRADAKILVRSIWPAKSPQNPTNRCSRRCQFVTPVTGAMSAQGVADSDLLVNGLWRIHNWLA